MARTAVDVPAPEGLPFSAAIRAGEFFFLSGQVGYDAGRGALIGGGVRAETEKLLANAEAVLAAAGKSLDDVIKVNVYLADMADYAAMNEVYAAAFASPYPARTCVAVRALPLGAAVEMEFVAH